MQEKIPGEPPRIFEHNEKQASNFSSSNSPSLQPSSNNNGTANALANIPHEMRNFRQWIVWRLEWRKDDPRHELKPTKIPYQVSGWPASITDAKTWNTFDAVAALAPFTSVDPCEHDTPIKETGFSGIGFVFTRNDPFAGIDLDDCHGDPEAFARQIKIFREFNSYSELSPSGSGLHIIIKAKLPSKGRRRASIELYDCERYFTMTGNVHHAVAIAERQQLAELLYEQMGGPVETYIYGQDQTEKETDENIIARASAAVNGDKFQTLFAGNWDGLYPSQSEADFALVDIVAFYTQNRNQIARIFRKSGLGQRDKAKRSAYVDRMIDKGLNRQSLPVVEGQAAFVKNFQDKFSSQFNNTGANGTDGSATSKHCNGLRFQLLNGTALAALPVAPWRIHSVFPAQGLASIYGPSASGKSFLALDMAAAIAEGRWWFGWRVKSAPVVYVCLEGEGGFKARCAAWEKHKARPLPQGLSIVLQPFALTNQQDVRELAEAIRILGGGVVVFIDTLNRAAPEADENSSKDMGSILQSAKQLQQHINGLVVLISHTGKDATKGLRGHSSLVAAMDATIEVTRDGDRRSLRVAKSKDGKDGTEHLFRLDVVELGEDEDGEAITSCIVVPEIRESFTKKDKAPKGVNQKIAWDAVLPMFAGGKSGKAGAPTNQSLCIELDAAVNTVAARLVCEPQRRKERARAAIGGLISLGLIGHWEDCLWQA